MKNKMSTKITNFLIIVIAVEFTIFIGIYLLTIDIFWFYTGTASTLIILILIYAFRIVFSTSKMDLSSEIGALSGNIGIHENIRINNSEEFLDQAKKNVLNLKERISSKDEVQKDKIIVIQNKFDTLIEDLKSRLKSEHLENEKIQISQNLNSEHLSEIKNIFRSEIENFNEKFQGNIDHFSQLEESVDNRFNNFKDNIIEELNLVLEKKIESFTSNWASLSSSQKKTIGKVKEDKEEKKEKIDTTLQEVDDQPVKTKEKLGEIEQYDQATEILIDYVGRKYFITRDKSIELLQKIEVNAGKKLTNKEYRNFLYGKNLDELIEMLHFKPSKKLDDKPTSKEKKDVISLIGKDVKIISMKKDSKEIEFDKNTYKIQKNMNVESVQDFIEIEDRIKRFFKNRDILIVHCENLGKYYIYYKK